MWIRQVFLHIAILLSSEVSIVFNVSSLHVNTNLSNRHFPHEQFLISKYSSILHALLHSQPHLLWFHM